MSDTLRLPLEVIERILHLALGSDLPPSTPFAHDSKLASSPPSSTAHLLRISKAITELVLPSYWRSVTILRAKDWARLWDPETGSFAGEAGRERARWVEEINVNVHTNARIPVDRARVRVHYPADDCLGTYITRSDPHVTQVLAALQVALLPRLRNVCLFETEVDYDDGQDREHGQAGDEEEDYRQMTGEELWEEKEQIIWNVNATNRWECHLEDQQAEQDEDDYLEPNRTEWEQQDDEVDRLFYVRGRAEDLVRAREKILNDLLHIVDPDRPMLHVLADGHTPRLFQVWDAPKDYRIKVYVGPDEQEDIALGPTRAFMPVPFDFVGVPRDARALALDGLIKAYGSDDVRKWRWVNEDGTVEALL